LGLALIAALIAALVGPFFIDWGGYRGTFEQQASRIAGVPVRVMGDVEARFLPSPRIRFGHVRAGRDGEGAQVEADDFALDLALAPLLSGQYRITKLTLSGVELKASVGADGTLDLPFGAGVTKGELDNISIDDVAVRNGRIKLADATTGRDLVVEGVTISGQASALSGPLKLDATGTANGSAVRLNVSSGAIQNGAGRVKAVLQGADIPVIDLDGTLAMPEGRPNFDGKMTVSPVPDAPGAPWRVTGQVQAGPRRVSATALEVLYGREGQGLKLTGTGDVNLGAAPLLRTALQARQFDLDRALGRAKDAPALPPLEALRAYLDSLPGSPRVGLPVEGSIAIESVVIGGDVVSGARAQLASAEQGWAVRALDMKLPGGAMVGTAGTLAVNEWSPPSYSGRVTVDVPNAPALLQWLQGAEKRPELGLRKLALAADLVAKPDVATLENLKLGLDGNTVGGRLTWSDPADAAPRLTAQLTADALDLDALNASRLLASLAPSGVAIPDMEVALNAAKLTYAKVTLNGVDADVTATAAGADIRRLVVNDLGGARIEAKGRIGRTAGRADGQLDGRIEARSLDGVLAVLDALPVPRGLVDALRPRTAALAPASLNANLSSDGTAYALRLDGSAGATRIGLTANSEDATGARLKDARLDASSEDGAKLLRQIGLPVAGFEPQGAAKLDLTLGRDGGKGLTVEGALAAAGGRIHLRGRSDDEFTLKGHAELNLEDAGRIAVLLGRASPLSLPVIPVDLNGDVMWRNGEITADLVTGFVDRRAASGRLSYAKGAVGGTVDLASVSLTELLGAAIGPMALSEEDAAGWPSGAVGPGLFDGIEGKVALRTGALELAPGYVAGKADLTLALSPNEFAAQDVTAVLAGGALKGNLAVRKAGAEASVAVRMSLEGGALGDLVWGPRSRPVAVGTLDVTADALGSGKSLSALAAGLTGSGTFAVRDGRINGADAAAFARTLASIETKDTPPDAAEVGRRFETELAYGDLPVAEVTSAFTLASGVLRISNAAITSPDASATASADIDLARAQIAGRLMLRPTAFEATAGAAAPQAQLSFSGPLASPARSVDTTAFTSFLTVRALDREMKRVAEMEAQRQERARVAAEEAERRRQQAADAARLKAIIESTGTVPMGELPPPVEFKRAPAPAPVPAPPPAARRQVSPFDIFRRSAE
jgi:uncharacterized protein involved in outer membrane biogenesis